MMRMSSRERGVEPKREGESKAGSSSSRQWAGGLRNPRIVRVSRSFGGKDRHSKVCTIRGLRDRRIRLSVPTAIQLYDLQDRLGLTQPSKVIDWLLQATQLHIDNLPPLQIPQGFAQHPFFDTKKQRSLSTQQAQGEEDINVIGNHLEAPPNLFGFLHAENNPLNGHFLPSAQLFFCPPAAPSPFPHMVEGLDPRHIQLLTSAPHHRIKSPYFNPIQDESQPHPE